MRVYLDTNAYLSYLLKPLSTSPPSALVRAGLSGDFTILIGDPTVREIIDKATGKPYLAGHIAREDVDDFLSLLLDQAERIQDAPTIIPAVCRDRKDDYLLTYSLIGHADYLVSGDKDLLDLGRVEDLNIVTPAEFLALLEAEAR
ncbi:MAG TPA: putative toxin-antitoxin system toxin component, PIN family [Thermomicrobiales bacterium]|nr:putative toxin-antitoxin system toxin component, PIN family [Thermomicrobiales bacterium]